MAEEKQEKQLGGTSFKNSKKKKKIQKQKNAEKKLLNQKNRNLSNKIDNLKTELKRIEKEEENFSGDKKILQEKENIEKKIIKLSQTEEKIKKK